MEIKDVFKNRLEGETLTTALGFIDYLIDKGITPKKEWDNGFRFILNEKSPCLVVLTKNAKNIDDWFICDVADYSNPEWDSLNDDLKKFILANIKICSVYEGDSCGCGSEPGISMNIFGKEYHNLCTSPIQLIFPQSDVLDKFKEYVEWWIINIANRCSA